jgi:hypothetical protein
MNIYARSVYEEMARDIEVRIGMLDRELAELAQAADRELTELAQAADRIVYLEKRRRVLQNELQEYQAAIAAVTPAVTPSVKA